VPTTAVGLSHALHDRHLTLSDIGDRIESPERHFVCVLRTELITGVVLIMSFIKRIQNDINDDVMSDAKWPQVSLKFK